jgi:hypothetical protein
MSIDLAIFDLERGYAGSSGRSCGLTARIVLATSGNPTTSTVACHISRPRGTMLA